MSGQVVVITGAARGLGALLARRLAAGGATLALLGLEPEELEKTARACGKDASWHEADVTDAAAVGAAAQQILDQHGRVDVVVANAGIAVGGPFLHSDPATFNRVIEVNLLGSINTARAFLPALVESRGYLLQIASLAAMAAAPMMAAYCASKSGVEAFAHSLRAEVAHHGVAVGVAYLSWTDTDMVRGAAEGGELAETLRKAPYPLSRVYPAGPAVAALARGIARRAPHVYAQRWLPPVQLIRGLLPAVIFKGSARDIADAEQKWLASGSTAAVGRGGAADTQAREKHP